MSEVFVKIVNLISLWAIPAMILVIIITGVAKRVKVYECFVDGAKEGFNVSIRIIPYLVAILFAIGMFRASGGMALLVELISPLTNLIGMPAETLPVALMRPLSGSGTLGIVTELMTANGPDSLIGRIASTMYGSTETTFYVLAVYFGSVAVTKTRHAAAVGLLADAVGLLAAVLICRVVFGA